MNKQRKVVITTTYNEMGIIIDTKVEELGSSAQPEIIRCKDCKFYNAEEKECLDLYGYGRRWEETDYCSYAKRREE